MAIVLTPQKTRFLQNGGGYGLAYDPSVINETLAAPFISSGLSLYAPTVTEPAEIVHGDTLTLGYADFGLSSGAFGADPETGLFDTIDNQAAYSGLSNGDAVPVGTGKVYADNVGGLVKYFTSGNVAARHAFDTARYGCIAGDANDGDLGIPLDWREGNAHSDGIYVSWWTYIDGAWSGSESSKIIRVWGTEDGATKYLSWTNDKYDCVLGGNDPASPTPDGQIWDDLSYGSWIRYEVWIDRRTDTATVFRGWENGVQWAQGAQNTITADCSAMGNPFIASIGRDAGGTPTYPAWGVTDIYSSERCARIELTGSATWSRTGAREIQEVLSWTSNTVQIRVFQGAHASLEGKYLHFIDEDDSAIASVALASLTPD